MQLPTIRHCRECSHDGNYSKRKPERLYRIQNHNGYIKIHHVHVAAIDLISSHLRGTDKGSSVTSPTSMFIRVYACDSMHVQACISSITLRNMTVTSTRKSWLENTHSFPPEVDPYRLSGVAQIIDLRKYKLVKKT